MRYEIHEVDASAPIIAGMIHRFNSRVQEWPPLLKHHLENGFWWLAFIDEAFPIAFAGLVPFEPFPNIGYMKRCYVAPDHHGHGLQFRMMCARELKARQLGWTQLVSECRADNSYSAANFRRAGFERCDPEQCWGEPGSIYWVKNLAR
jgi:L-amino acid N-acyltransferase YncA